MINNRNTVFLVYLLMCDNTIFSGICDDGPYGKKNTVKNVPILSNYAKIDIYLIVLTKFLHAFYLIHSSLVFISTHTFYV